jgi:Ca2+-transporting ATPase
LISGVRLGRRIFVNLRKALTYVIAIHVPIASVALFPILLGMPPMLMPVHVMLLELIIDPVVALVFEAEPSETHAMLKPPRPAGESLFGLRQMGSGALFGGVIAAAVLAIYEWALRNGLSEEAARATGFITLVLGNLALAFAQSGETGGRLFETGRGVIWLVLGSAMLILTAILVTPLSSGVFKVALPPPQWLLGAAGLAVLAGGWSGILRKFMG